MLTHSLSGQHVENEMPLFAQVCPLEHFYTVSVWSVSLTLT